MVSSVSDAILTTLKVLDAATNDNKNEKELNLLLSQGSMTKLLSEFIIEPKIVVSKTLKTHASIDDVINAEIDIFVSLYTRVFDMMLSVYGFDAAFALNTLSSRDTYGDAITFESDMKLLKIASSDTPTFPLDVVPTVENEKGGKKVIREVELSSAVTDTDGKSVPLKIKVLVVASIVYAGSQDIYRMIDVNTDRNNIGSRIDDYRAGAISLMNLITANDLVKEYKKNRIKDTSGLLKAVEARKTKSTAKLLTNKAIGFSKFYQMIIISNAEKEYVERLIGGKLSNRRFKDKLLDHTASLSISVMDDDYELLEIFLKDLADSIPVPYKKLKNGKKDDVSEVLKFMMNKELF